MAMKISVDHIGIPAADPVALKNWYEHALGTRTIWDSGEIPPAYLVAFSGGGWLEIYAAKERQSAPENNNLQGFRHLALRVDSLEAATAEATRRGVVFTKEPGPAAGACNTLLTPKATCCTSSSDRKIPNWTGRA